MEIVVVNNIGIRMWKLTKKLCGTQAAPASSEEIGCTRLSQHDVETKIMTIVTS